MVALYFVEAAEASSSKKKRTEEGPRDQLMVLLSQLVGQRVVDPLLNDWVSRCEIMRGGKVT